jgi:hypothetical protein
MVNKSDHIDEGDAANLRSRPCVSQITRSARRLLFAGISVVFLAMPAAAADVTAIWNNTSGNWSDATKWSSNPLFPNNGNGGFTYVAIINGGTVALNQDVVINALTQSGGTIGGGSNLTVTTGLDWTNGTLGGTGTTTIEASGTLNLSGFGVNRYLDRNLVNNGAVNWTGGSGLVLSAVTIQNNGTLTFGPGGSFPGISGSSGTFNNAGSIIKQTSNTASINTLFNNTGSVEVQAGQMNFWGGGSHAGDFTGAAGTTLYFVGSHTFAASSDITGGLNVTFDGDGVSNGLVNIGGALAVSGGTATFHNDITANTLNLSGGTATFNDTLTAPSATLAGGTITGTANWSIPATFDWTNGTLGGTGTTTIEAGATLNLSGNGVTRTLGRNLINNGAVNWTGGSGLAMSAVTFQNNGTLTFGPGGSFPGISGSSGTFHNAGSIIKQTSNTASINTLFNNTGSVEVQDGTLALNAPSGHQTGQFNVGATGVLSFSNPAPQTVFGPTSTFTGSGEVQFRSDLFSVDNAGPTDNFTIHQTTVIDATLSLTDNENFDSIDLHNSTLDHASNVDINGKLWVNSYGKLQGAGRTDANGAHTINGSFEIGSGHQFRSIGAGVVQPNKDVSIYSGGRWDVLSVGTVDFQGSNTIWNPNLTGYMLNQGTITKTGDGVTDVGVQFENDGLLHVQDTSRWDLRKNANHGGTFSLDADSALRLKNGSTHTFLPTSEISGEGELQLVQGSTAVIQGDLDVGLISIDGGSTLDMQVDGRVGTLELNDGSLAGPGNLAITSSIVFSGNSSLASDITTSSGTDILNRPSGSLSISVPIDIRTEANAAAGSLVNEGTIIRTGSGTSVIELNTQNRGTISISTGSGLVLPNGYGQEFGSIKVDGHLESAGFTAKSGSIKGNGTIKSPTTNVGTETPPPGKISINIQTGASPGHLTFDGDVTFGHYSIIESELGGVVQGGSYDWLQSTGMVSLGGGLDVVLLNGFTPQLNDTFQILTAGSLTGQFESAQLPTLTPGLRWNVQYAVDSVTLLVEAGIAGDFNNDQHVDAADYVCWREYFNHDQIKYNQWRANFGQSLGSGSAFDSSVVPEPDVIATVLSAIAGFVAFRRWTRGTAQMFLLQTC